MISYQAARPDELPEDSALDMLAVFPPPEAAPCLLNENCSVHHLGFAVRSISAVGEEFARSMSARWDGKIIHDPLQRVRVAFFHSVNEQNPIFELIEPAAADSPVSNFLKKRVGLHHVCYETNDLEARLRDARSLGWVLVAEPEPAVAFDGRRIGWVCSANFLLIEFLERERR